ncbi:hypothetical protein [Nonomuraea insulae]|uniref:Uncharacterized protein n=1 Tax=Nonomuraea insulae TaxID=1616787 RepID=A0ABW1CWY4_9ACTN
MEKYAFFSRAVGAVAAAAIIMLAGHVAVPASGYAVGPNGQRITIKSGREQSQAKVCGNNERNKRVCTNAFALNSANGKIRWTRVHGYYWKGKVDIEVGTIMSPSDPLEWGTYKRDIPVSWNGDWYPIDVS